MIVGGGLLKALQSELGRLEADLGAKVVADSEVRSRLECEWREAFDARRTGAGFEAWRDDRLTQVAVAWLLACVFVRFCEDNHLIDEAAIGGPGERGEAARAAQQRWFAAYAHESDREYLQSVFRSAATLPGLGGLLAEGESPLWLVDPPADACTRLLTLFRSTDGAGDLVHDFTDAGWSTRFLGDLYQDLSEHAKSTYALLQTPEFVEEFILDRTLTPAIETFGLARTTLIDPTCGSGHFLLGAFDRLWKAWSEAEPGVPERVLAQRALDQVTGVDLNPFAAAIARFRLLVAAVKASGIKRLADGPDFHIDIAVGDSLLWGARPGQFGGRETASTSSERLYLYRTEHADALRRIFDRRYTAVVGNPPYIVCRDPALNKQYRGRYGSCHRQYSLAVPFMEKFFDLALLPDTFGRPAGHVGMITANSFMKREFGKKLIETYIPTWDLTHVIDTSGAYIPGHGTPTVILFGRHQRPFQPVIRTVMGIRGEPSTPADPAKGLVWTAITSQVDDPGSESDFVTVGDTDRNRFATHPWSIGGGGAAELKEVLDHACPSTVNFLASEIGFMAITGDDNVFAIGVITTGTRLGLPKGPLLVEGDLLRDWAIDGGQATAWPYDSEIALIKDIERHGLGRFLWPYRRGLQRRKRFGIPMEELGRPWYEWRELYDRRLRTPLSIVFAFMATHNHFVLDRGGKVFKQSAPVIKLAEGASVDEHLGLVGLLNSAVACFWMQQVFHNKGRPGADSAAADEGWEFRYEHDGTKLQQFPLPPGPPPVELARTIDGLATELAALQPGAVAASATPTRARLDAARTEAVRIFAQMVAAQEELDWTCLHLYGLSDEPLTVPADHTPPPLKLGERAFEIILARKVAAGEVETAWFTRHRSTPITDLPGHWPGWYRDLVQRRIDLIERDRDVALVERPEHKRRWARAPWTQLEQSALQSWLADRLEDRRLWFEGSGETERAVCRSLAQLADRVVALDPEFLDVARLWKNRVEIDPVAVIAELVADEHVPAQSASRYRAKGLEKRRVWERTWDLQRMEDRGEPLPGGLDRIPVPPRYAQGDFAKASYWRQRGKLDVPKERFTSITGAERDADPTMVLAWAGFDHAQLAQAVATLAVDRQQTDGWDADRTWPLVVALAELLPWLDQWHAEVDPRWSASPATLYRQIAEQFAVAGGRSLADASTWRPAAPTRGRAAKSSKAAQRP